MKRHFRMNKTKLIKANLMDLDLDLDLDFEDILRFCDISVLVTFHFWYHFSFGDISVLVTFSFDDISVLVTF